MALTLVTTPGSATANSYCSLARAAVLADETAVYPEAWFDADEDEQARALKYVTERIDQERFDPRSTRVDAVQALEFPRAWARLPGNNGYESETAIPARVERATAEGAFEFLRLKAAGGDPTVPVTQQITSFGIPFQFSATLRDGSTTLSAFEQYVGKTLRPLLGNLLAHPGLVPTVRG